MEKKPLKEDSNPHKLLDLNPRERIKWLIKTEDCSSDEKKLELRLGLPGHDNEESKPKKTQGYNGNYDNQNYQPLSMGFSTDNKKRAAPAPVVGWPPIRSCRKNLASSSSAKPVPNPPLSALARTVKASEIPTEKKGLFVKINMEGVPIGRKVDLRAYDNYDKLCSVVDTLFRRLLAVRSEQEREKPITGLLDGSGEYTLLYEDNEGDRMLVGDVPWNMFVSTVKRLRVLKTSELPSLRQ